MNDPLDGYFDSAIAFRRPLQGRRRGGAGMNWRAYFPDDGQGPSDAVDLQHSAYRPRTIYDAEDAAKVACELDYNRRDGWERGEYEFAIAIIAPDGTETRWKGMHERTIAHTVREDDEAEDQP